MFKGLRQLPIFVKYPVTKELIKFALVGVVNSVIDIYIYFILTRFAGFYYLLASLLSFTVAVTFSFFFNRSWTFRVSGYEDAGRQYFKFLAANSISLTVNLLFLYLAVDFFGWHDLSAKIVATLLVGALNFSLNKLWTFRAVETA